MWRANTIPFIPAQAGIHTFDKWHFGFWVPAFAGANGD